jgi:hypothetical protein
MEWHELADREGSGGKGAKQKVNVSPRSDQNRSSGRPRRVARLETMLTFCSPDVDLDGGVTARVENLQVRSRVKLGHGPMGKGEEAPDERGPW